MQRDFARRSSGGRERAVVLITCDLRKREKRAMNWLGRGIYSQKNKRTAHLKCPAYLSWEACLYGDGVIFQHLKAVRVDVGDTYGLNIRYALICKRIYYVARPLHFQSALSAVIDMHLTGIADCLFLHLVFFGGGRGEKREGSGLFGP